MMPDDPHKEVVTGVKPSLTSVVQTGDCPRLLFHLDAFAAAMSVSGCRFHRHQWCGIAKRNRASYVMPVLGGGIFAELSYLYVKESRAIWIRTIVR